MDYLPGRGDEVLFGCQYDGISKMVAVSDIPTGTIVYEGNPLFTVSTDDRDVLESEINKLNNEDRTRIEILVKDFYPGTGSDDIIEKVKLNAFMLENGRVGMHYLASKLNHSCQANCSWYSVGNRLVFRSIVDIRKGDQLTHCYYPICSITHSVVKRRQIVKENGFYCECDVCNERQAYNPSHYIKMMIEHDRCFWCNKKTTVKCRGCGVARYCNKNCQRMHWKRSHKGICKK